VSTTLTVGVVQLPWHARSAISYPQPSATTPTHTSTHTDTTRHDWSQSACSRPRRTGCGRAGKHSGRSG